MSGRRFIVHVDMDAFFAAVEQRDHPGWRGWPLVVGADPKGGQGRGVVAAASYEARAFGIHSAMPISRAYRLCPKAVFVRGNHEKYERESDRVFSVLERFTPDVEPLSIDEAFLDITRSHHLFGTVEETCLKIKADVKAETGLTASIGMAPNKFTAKIASDIGKPDGFVVVTPEGLLDFLHPLPVEKLWGVGPVMKRALAKAGIHSVGDLARRSLPEMVRRFGAAGEHVWRLANGIDPREVTRESEAKSVGAEHTFDEDTSDANLLRGTLSALCERVSRRMRKEGVSGRTVVLKIRFQDFSTHTRSRTLPRATNFFEEIYRAALAGLELFDTMARKARLLGVSVGNLDSPKTQLSLFDAPRPEDDKKDKLHHAVDAIKDKFGEQALIRRRIK